VRRRGCALPCCRAEPGGAITPRIVSDAHAISDISDFSDDFSDISDTPLATQEAGQGAAERCRDKIEARAAHHEQDDAGAAPGTTGAAFAWGSRGDHSAASLAAAEPATSASSVTEDRPRASAFLTIPVQ